MAQLLKHYWVNRDNISEYAVSSVQYSRSMFGVVMPNIEGLNVVHRLEDENTIPFFLSTCPDETVIEETTGLQIITQAEWDFEIAEYDLRQETKRYDVLRKYRNKLLEKSDWFVVKSVDTQVSLASSFTTWRQDLRDLPDSSSFPASLPDCPESINVDLSFYSQYNSELRSIPMINDPLPPADPEPFTEVPLAPGIPIPDGVTE